MRPGDAKNGADTGLAQVDLSVRVPARMCLDPVLQGLDLGVEVCRIATTVRQMAAVSEQADARLHATAAKRTRRADPELRVKLAGLPAASQFSWGCADWRPEDGGRAPWGGGSAQVSTAFV
ncbi:hypothetical protein AB0J28_21150 [Streptosporangium canum]|uniref:hypothetical protein n=1 Tax=Streptosporangium canum TaxID=324952 RepID=UPI003427AB1D